MRAVSKTFNAQPLEADVSLSITEIFLFIIEDLRRRSDRELSPMLQDLNSGVLTPTLTRLLLYKWVNG